MKIPLLSRDLRSSTGAWTEQARLPLETQRELSRAGARIFAVLGKLNFSASLPWQERGVSCDSWPGICFTETTLLNPVWTQEPVRSAAPYPSSPAQHNETGLRATRRQKYLPTACEPKGSAPAGPCCLRALRRSMLHVCALCTRHHSLHYLLLSLSALHLSWLLSVPVAQLGHGALLLNLIHSLRESGAQGGAGERARQPKETKVWGWDDLGNGGSWPSAHSANLPWAPFLLPATICHPRQPLLPPIQLG